MSDSGWDFPPGGGAQGPAGPPGVTAGADLAVRSITVLPNSPYLPIAAAGTASLTGIQDVNGKNLLTFVATASAVDYLEIANAATGGIPTIWTRGTDSFIPMNFAAKGGSTTLSAFTFYGTGGVNQILALVNNYTGGGVDQVNYIEIDNATTGGAPLIAVGGSGVDSNVSLVLRPRGTGSVDLQGGHAGLPMMATFRSVANGVNYLEVDGAATGGFVTVYSRGGDAFTGLNFAAPGGSTTVPQMAFYGTGGVNQMLTLVNNYTGGSPNQVNYWEMDNGTTGVSPLLGVQGLDGNVDLRMRPHGTGSFVFEGDVVPRGTIFKIVQPAAVVNYLQVQASSTGNPITLSTQGTDGSVDLNIVPKGSGWIWNNNNIKNGKATPTYSASISPNAALGPWQTITVTNATAFTINAPSNPPSSSLTTELTIEISNTSGGAMGVITWNAAFVFVAGAFTNPATGKARFVSFEWNGLHWIEIARASADYTP